MKLDEGQIINALDYQIERANSFLENRVSWERATAYNMYYGRPFGNEVEGRSQIVSQDVAQVIDSLVPTLVKTFVGGDKAVEFVPRGPEDVESAEQATISCNYVFFTQNNGYAITHNAIKDGLLQKTGTVSWAWEEKEEKKKKTFNGLDDMQMMMLIEEVEKSGAKIIGHDEVEQIPGQPMHNVEVEYVKKYGCIKINVIPPEEVLISPDAMSLDPYEMNFIAHTPLVTASDLRELGIKQAIIDQLPQGDDGELFSDERIARKNRLDATQGLVDESDAGPDKSQYLYRLYRCYIRMDVDGDGIAELREIWKVGDTLLRNEEVDHIPMAIWTPKVMAHECIGISPADDVMDIQELKSTLWRQGLDNIYLSNAPRMYINEGMVNLDDVLTVRPGGIIRGNGPAGNNIQPIVVPAMIQHVFQALEYADQEEEVRTGVSRLFQGIDPQSINKTATGVNALINQANARVELMARNCAEFLFKPMFKGILYLLSKHQTEALMVRLQNSFVPIDPETWSKEYDMSVNVGLGTGTKEQQMAMLNNLMMIQAQMIQSPAGQMFPPPVWYSKVYNAASKIAENSGFKDPSQYFPSPEEMQPPPPPGPPPEVQVAQMKIQAEQQTEQMKMQGDAQKAQMDAQFKSQEGEQKAILAEKQARIDAEVQLAIAQMKAQIDAATKIEIARINAMAAMGMQRQETDGVNQ